MSDILNRFDSINKERFLDIICGEVDLELGTVEGTYKEKPCEFLVMVIDAVDTKDEEENEVLTIIPLATFLSEKDMALVDIPNNSEVEVVEFTDDEDELDLDSFNPKGPLH